MIGLILATTLFFAGDSTLDDHGFKHPYRSWGRETEALMAPGNVISNFARSGHSTKSFRADGLSVARLFSDASVNRSSEMNQAVGYAASAGGGELRVLFLGNSITLHAPAPKIGWTNAWGMAASAAERDYVHLVTRGIEAKTGRKARVLVKNIADFERGYRGWCPGDHLKKEAAFDPDYLIVAVGENVPTFQYEQDKADYREAFDRLLGFFIRNRHVRPNAVVRGVFWRNDARDALMADVASDLAVPFVKTDFAEEPGMKAGAPFWHKGVANHPGDKGMAETARRILEALFPSETDFAVTVGGQSVKVRPIRISAMPYNQWAPNYQRPVNQTETAACVTIEAEGATEVRVRTTRPFKSLEVRPRAANVKPMVENGEIVLRLPKLGFYVLELDGQHRPLEIFLQAKRDFAQERATATVVFGPGVHDPGVVTLRSHDRVYIDRDAEVRGSFQAKGVEDVRIFGYGAISGVRNHREGNCCYREGLPGTVRLVDSKNVVIDGPIVLDSANWCLAAFNCDDIEVANIKVTGQWRYNTDGVDMCNSRRVRIRDSYVHSFDDAIVLKGIPDDCTKPVEDIRTERCVLSCSWGRTCEIGAETMAPHYRNVLFEDCDLIHNSDGALSVHLTGPAPLENVVYRNLRVEYSADDSKPQISTRYGKYSGKAPYAGSLIIVSNGKNGAYWSPKGVPFGNFDKLVFENVSASVGPGAAMPFLVFKNDDKMKEFGAIEIRKLTVNGRPVRSSADIHVSSNPTAVRQLTFGE